PILSSTSLIQSQIRSTTMEVLPNKKHCSLKEKSLRKVKSEYDIITVVDDGENENKILTRKRSRKFDNVIGITTRQTRTKTKHQISSNSTLGEEESEENERYQHCEHCPLLYQLSPEQQRQASTPTISKKVIKEQKCNWYKCKRGLIPGSLFEHLMEHVQEQKKKKKEQCLWVGCKVFKTPSKCANYLEKHIHKHTNEKPYRCVFDNCFEKFTTQNAVERHVQTHLKADESAFMNGNCETDSIFMAVSGDSASHVTKSDNDYSDNKIANQQHQRTVLNSKMSNSNYSGNHQNNLIINNKPSQQQTKINRKRKAAKVNGVQVTYVSNRDCFTDSEAFHLNRLFESWPYISVESEDPTIVLEPNVTMKRQIGDVTENFIEWQPEGVCLSEWIRSRVAHVDKKKISIQELNSEQLNRLLPPVYKYRQQPHHDIGANSSEIENSSSEDEDEEDLVDNCWDDETDDQGHCSEDNLSNEDDDEYVLLRDSSQTQRATFAGIRVFDKINPKRSSSYFHVKIGDKWKYLFKQSACWLLTDNKTHSSSDRLKHVMESGQQE
ncbi:unnamed protein product, partial [Didymodactylos carnosus]